jgi:hypothetical protein
MRIELEVDDALAERMRMCLSGRQVQALIVRTLERECAKAEKRMTQALGGTIRFFESRTSARTITGSRGAAAAEDES